MRTATTARWLGALVAVLAGGCSSERDRCFEAFDRVRPQFEEDVKAIEAAVAAEDVGAADAALARASDVFDTKSGDPRCHIWLEERTDLLQRYLAAKCVAEIVRHRAELMSMLRAAEGSPDPTELIRRPDGIGARSCPASYLEVAKGYAPAYVADFNRRALAVIAGGGRRAAVPAEGLATTDSAEEIVRKCAASEELSCEDATACGALAATVALRSGCLDAAGTMGQGPACAELNGEVALRSSRVMRACGIERRDALARMLGAR